MGDVNTSILEFRYATEQDLPAILDMLLSDSLTKSRFQGEADYLAAFREIVADRNNVIIVGVLDGEVAASLQITYIPGLSYGGAWRAQIEGVRVRDDLRGRGIGAQMIEWAIEQARERGCRLMQFTSDVRRVDARRFYERLGFVASHIGMKKML